MITTILLSFLIPTTLGIVGWAYNLSLNMRSHNNTLEFHDKELKRLREEFKETDYKYVEILKTLMEIKLELQNKVNRKD